MARFLLLGLNGDGELQALTVTDPSGTTLPHGDHGAFLDQMDDVDELTAIVELPEGDFRPTVFDPVGDTEARMGFFDLQAGDLSVAGPDSGVTGDDSVDNTAANNG
jgi:hypothetical protein